MLVEESKYTKQQRNEEEVRKYGPQASCAATYHLVLHYSCWYAISQS